MSKEQKISDTDLKKVSGGSGVISHLQDGGTDRDNQIGGSGSIDTGGSGPGPESSGGGAGSKDLG